MAISDKYEAVIGLEVHAQLATNSKLFCGDRIQFGAEPNTHISPITMAYPGTLPKTNAKAIEYAVKMGIACDCEIVQINYFARKNYFYPDLPKGYQISQHSTPICKGGQVKIKLADKERYIQLNRIHLEEDAGKSIHDIDDEYTCIDLNRAGTPLIEIVTEPDLFSADEAWQYVSEIRKMVRWLNICDGNMEEGSLRCDANVSIRLKGETKLGTKVEVKNLNSIRNIKKAIEFEIDRMIDIVENGGTIQQQTRSFDASNDTTFAMRDKEEANDYRYFPDPDLPAFVLSNQYLEGIQKNMPLLPEQLYKQFQIEYSLNNYDAAQLTEDKATADYFQLVVVYTKNYKQIANWMLGPLKQILNEQSKNFSNLDLDPKLFAELIQLVEDGKLNFSIAAAKILPLLFASTASPLQLAEQLQIIQVSDTNELAIWVDEVIAAMPDKVAEYQKGKKGLIGLFVGEVKKKSKGKADPKMVTQLIEAKLNQ
jgi:aspartyl-tRNA(Asn)/glutamyl-tRNA(Gln) amidotransferase subunit B